MGKTYEKSAATRQRIVSAAMSLFRLHGYSNVSVKDIVRESGVAHGSFYTYFKNKDNLLGEYLQTMEDDYFRYHETRMKDPEYSRLDPMEKIYRFLADVNQIMAAPGKDFFRAYNAYTIREMDILGIHNRNYFRILESLLDQARARNQINPAMSNEHILQAAVAMNRGIVTEWSVDGQSGQVSDKDPLLREFCQYIACPDDSSALQK
ncbi:TetR/AcrR family transcriptional regulator [Oscillibacter sp. MSJ-2]|uniref:TetR/AcrR family transcriptional regulator n=1 Tax=Dysosmobacter acutus TaxID=2841504 RepID=A0ABS6F8J5_9FIRM|nr:TetR/AcrR family transcriptional regulator [Dysosmobacter acutus]MBU5626609.1 TetR/AcrR family transcriptional regulator [Dysosmobacter acutus]